MWARPTPTKEKVEYTLVFEPQRDFILEPKELTNYLNTELLAKWKLEAISAALRTHYLNRFKKRQTPKYGSINRGFTEQQLQAFLHAVDNPKLRLLFEYMAQLGLRIGEAVAVNISGLDLETRELTLRTEKSKQLDTMLIPLPLFKKTIEFIKENAKDIEECGGCIFYKDKHYSHSNRAEGGLEPNYVRNRFRMYLEAAKLDQTYDISEEQNGRTPRRLHKLTSHSLRHYAITRFARQTNGNLMLTSKFARHKDPNTTTIYVHTDKKEIYDVVNSLALSEVEALKRRVGK